ncbi:MAG: exonuclease domain-containing protein [Pirellulales bacterium]
MLHNFTGFAVFDLETTGIAVSKHHRIIEIGVVRLDEDLELVEEWETLINPERDIGASDIHGLFASDLRDAPTFRDIVADVWHRFEGAIPVAHNFSFDRQFIVAEFSRAGIELEDFDGICTMRLAGDCGLACGARKLAELCRQLSIPTLDTHSAGNDARMCANILKCVANMIDVNCLAKPVSCPMLWKRQATPLGITRNKAREMPIASPLQMVSQRLNSQAVHGTPSDGKLDEYLLVLDRVLEDRIVDPAETEELAAYACDCGIASESLQGLHERYFAGLLSLILADGIVTDDERRDLNRVAGLLGIPAQTVDRLLSNPPESNGDQLENLIGKTVCFTGEQRCSLHGERLTRDVAEAMAEAAGLIIAPRVTKKVDILVVADPDTASGKAKKAREYGIRIIAERPFWQKIGVAVD